MSLEKVVTDALKLAGVIEDDCLIDRWVMTRREIVKGGKVVITVLPWSGQPD